MYIRPGKVVREKPQLLLCVRNQRQQLGRNFPGEFLTYSLGLLLQFFPLFGTEHVNLDALVPEGLPGFFLQLHAFVALPDQRFPGGLGDDF